MGTLYIGRQGSGKTTSLARQLLESLKRFPRKAFFVLDMQGSISEAVLGLILQEPKAIQEALLARLVYDQPGHGTWATRLPEFSPEYESSFEEQAQRVANNLASLAPDLVTKDPFVAGLTMKVIAPNLFRLLTAIRGEDGQPWQVTEAKKLLSDSALLKRAIDKFGQRVPEAKFFFEHTFLRLSERERELRTYALIAMLDAVEPPAARARLGSGPPAWAPSKAVREAQCILLDGSLLKNQPISQQYLFNQPYSLIMSEINKRVPGDPNDQPVALVLDEVYSLLSVPGMAKEIGMLAPQYRSRKVEPTVVVQALHQLDRDLREQIWSMGNVVCFAVSNFEEAYEIAQQLFPYYPDTVKLTPKTDTQQPVIETDRGQFLQIANSIQRMRHRECIVRRYLSEKVLDKHVLWVPQTKTIATSVTSESVRELKQALLRQRGVPIREALRVVNQRKLPPERPERPAL